MIIVILLLVRSSYAGDGRYECGPNGRFEYCIDDNPGCVVGCHCYPGYFFDTDTKICEPNTKLTHDFRRHYIIDAGKGATTEPATTAPAPVVAKENDDLSDWLYNQFFKTIENQVVNKTDDDDLIQKGTRRSGGSPVITRRFKKKKSRKGSKKSKKGLRRKLLRITEDDSMFDSESDYDSSSGSSSWENWSAGDSEPNQKKPNHAHDHKGDHRKIVVFNKRPKPPLPSFIFLPNIETPFYPPIGLPMPPLPAPMYPMVPVPPIQPPPIGSTPASTPGSTAGSTAGTSSGAPTPATSAPTTTEKAKTSPSGAPDVKTDPTPPPNSDEPNPDEPKPDDPKQDDSKPDDPKQDDAKPDDPKPDDPKPDDPKTDAPKPDEPKTDAPKPDEPKTDAPKPDDPKTDVPNKDGQDEKTDKPLRAGRSKLLRGRPGNQQLNHLKQRKKPQRNPKRKKVTPGKLLRTPISEPFLNQFQNPLFGTGDDVFQQPILEDDTNHEDKVDPPFNNEVDFNYLSQLIHRVDLNGTTPASQQMKFNNNRNRLIEFMKSGPMPPPPGLRRAAAGLRRSLGAPDTQPDDSYYTKLGREIAKLIRDIHPDVEAHAEEHQDDDKASPFLFDDGFRSRSYWERFVRSPMKLRLGSFSKLGNLKSSNEKLFDLENKAEVVAESSSVLSLPELENVINAMRKAQNQIHHTYIRQSREKNKKTSNGSLNVSLLPPHKGKLTHVTKNTLSKDSRTQMGNRRRLTINQNFRRNMLNPSNTPSAPTNHAQNNYSPYQHVPVQHYNNDFWNNIILTTSAPNILYDVKNTNQLQPAVIHSNYLSNYYNMYNKIVPNLETIVTQPYRPYIESKPSYFFNEFDYFSI